MANPFSDGISVDISANADGFTDSINSARNSLDGFKGQLAVVGGALAALSAKGLQVAVGAASDFEEAMVGVEKVTDPATAERMGEAIKGMAGEMPLAHQELATIAETAGRLGVESQHLEGFTENVAMMATATDLTAEEAADSFARISTLMDLPIEDSEELGSAINELANNFGTSASEITDVMTRAGSSFKALGLGKDEALGLSAAMNEVSPSSRLAAGGLKRISEALMDPENIKDIATAFGMTPDEFQRIVDENPKEAIGMLATAMDEGGQTSTDLRKILGKTATELGTLGSNWDAAGDATEQAGGQFENATSLQEEFDAATSTFNAKLDIFKNRLRNIGIEIGETVLPAVSSFLDMLSGALGVFEKVNSATDGWLGAVVLIAGVVGGAIAAVAGFVSVMGGWAAVLTPVIAGLSAVKAAFLVLLGPVGVAIAIVAALAAAWKTNFGGIRDQTMRVINVLKTALAPAFQMLKSDGEGLVNSLKQGFTTLMGIVEPIFGRLVTWIADKLIVGIQAFGKALAEFIPKARNAFGTLKDVAMDAVSTLMGLWNEYGPQIISIATRVFNTLKTVATTALSALTGLWNQHIKPLLPSARQVFNTLATVVRTSFNILKTVISTSLNTISTLWNEYLMPLVERTRTIFNQVKQAVIPVIKSILSFVIPQVKRLVQIWQVQMQRVLAEARKTWNAIKPVIMPVLNWLRDAVNSVLTFVSGLWQQYGQYIVTLVKTYFGLVKNNIQTYLNAVKTVVTTVLNAVKAFWDVWGSDIVAALKMIFTTVKTVIVAAMDVVSSVIVAALQLIRGDWRAAWDTIVSLVQRNVERIKGLVSGWVDVIVGYFTTFKDQVIQKFTELYQRLIGGSIVPDMLNGITQAIDNFVSNVVTAVTNFVSTVIQKFTEWGNSLIQTVTNAVTKAKAQVDQKFNAIKSFITTTLDNIKSTVTTVLNNVVSTFKTTLGNVLSTVQNYLQRAVNTWKSLLNRTLSIIQNFGSKAVSAIKKIVSDMVSKIKSKASEFYNSGKSLIKEFISGIKSPNVGKAVADVVQGARDKLPFSPAKEGPLADLDKTGPAFLETIAGGIEGNEGRLQDAVASAVEQMTNQSPGTLTFPAGAVGGSRGTTISGVNVDITIEGDANRRHVRQGVSEGLADTLKTHNVRQ